MTLKIPCGSIGMYGSQNVGHLFKYFFVHEGEDGTGLCGVSVTFTISQLSLLFGLISCFLVGLKIKRK